MPGSSVPVREETEWKAVGALMKMRNLRNDVSVSHSKRKRSVLGARLLSVLTRPWGSNPMTVC